MKPELTKILEERYPEIFKGRYGGISCDDGWFALLNVLCRLLNENPPVLLQVKEKFGGLRFYVRGATEEQSNYITFAELMSNTICEKCGTTVDVKKITIMNWIRTACPAHSGAR